MKVKNLIEKLSRFNPNADVRLHGYNGLPVIFVLARAVDPMQVWLESEKDCDMGHQLKEFFNEAIENGIDELDIYSELLDLGITVDAVRRFAGDEQADQMKQFCEDHGLS